MDNLLLNCFDQNFECWSKMSTLDSRRLVDSLGSKLWSRGWTWSVVRSLWLVPMFPCKVHPTRGWSMGQQYNLLCRKQLSLSRRYSGDSSTGLLVQSWRSPTWLSAIRSTNCTSGLWKVATEYIPYYYFQIEDWKWVWISGDWAVVVWCGSNPMLEYNGGFVLSRQRSDGTLPPELEGEIKEVLETYGMRLEGMCLTDSTSCQIWE